MLAKPRDVNNIGFEPAAQPGRAGRGSRSNTLQAGLMRLGTKGTIMAHYLYQGAYTSDAVKTLIKKPTNRFEVVRRAVEKLGGRIEGAWFAFGEYDFVVILEMPDNVSAAALSLACAAGGAVHSGKTTPLLTQQEGVAAMKRAGTSGYLPPGK